MSQTLSLVCCLKAATAQEVLCYGLTHPPLFLLVSLNTFQVGNVKKWKQTKLQILQESCFQKSPNVQILP